MYFTIPISFLLKTHFIPLLRLTFTYLTYISLITKQLSLKHVLGLLDVFLEMKERRRDLNECLQLKFSSLIYSQSLKLVKDMLMQIGIFQFFDKDRLNYYM